MQPVSPYRTRNDSASTPPPDAGSGPTPPPDPADLPDLRDHTQDLGPLLQPMPRAAFDALPPLRDSAIQRGLDDFRRRMTPEFQTPDGPVRVPIPFRMNVPAEPSIEKTRNYPQTKAAQKDAGISGERLAVILAGRGAPSEIQRLTQALIDKYGIPPDPELSRADRIRKLMFDHRIGIDCAGYTQKAYLSATGLTRAEAGFAADETSEDLSRLTTSPAYEKIDPQNVRPGDIGVLKPPLHERFGHRVIAYDQREATPADIQGLKSLGDAAATFAEQGKIHLLKVDSSWGSGGSPHDGGVLRIDWWYSETNQTWAMQDGKGFRVTPKGPYNHSFAGFYRRRDSESLPLPVFKERP